jgi:hypothetical protein
MNDVRNIAIATGIIGGGTLLVVVVTWLAHRLP